jgi:tetratricopeptide (TPR) repeat protein
VSTGKLIAIFLFSVLLRGQVPGERFTVSGEIQYEGPLNGFEVQLFDVQNHTIVERSFTSSDGRFRFFQASTGLYQVRVVAAPGEEPVMEESHQLSANGSPLVLRLPRREENQAPAGTVSIRELAHPVKERAVRAAMQAQHYREANDAARAIEKFEEAIRIDSGFRDARTNLGALYAHAGRRAEAMEQFQKALEIGPPDVIIYANLAWGNLTSRDYSAAEDFARKAVAMDGKNAKAHFLLGAALAMQSGKEAEALEQLRISAPEQPQALGLMAKIRGGR